MNLYFSVHCFKFDDENDPITCNTNLDQVCSDLYNTKKYNVLKSTIKKIKQECGTVCDTEINSDLYGKYYPQLWKNIDCIAMFQHPIFDRLSEYQKPLKMKHLPHKIKTEFTYGGRLEIKPLYADNTNGKFKSKYSNFDGTQHY